MNEEDIARQAAEEGAKAVSDAEADERNAAALQFLAASAQVDSLVAHTELVRSQAGVRSAISFAVFTVTMLAAIVVLAWVVGYVWG